jgi:RNA polymerase sigma-70 factor (ECF subfamily)
MQEAVMGRVAPIAKARGATDQTDSRTLADRAMDRYADGDEAAFGTLYDELAPRLYRYALLQTHSRPASEDVVQQTFLQIHRARDRFVRGAAVMTWAYAIARHLIIDESRRRGHEELSDDGVFDVEKRSTELSADDALAQKEQELEARRDLEHLPPALRESFQLVKLEGLSVAQAAEVLGITPGMVKIRTHRARVALERAALARGPRDGRPAPPAGPAVAPEPSMPGSEGSGFDPDARRLREHDPVKRGATP